MKKRLLFFCGIIIVLLISCNKPKEESENINKITIDQINMDAFTKYEKIGPEEKIVEIYKFDSINIISQEGSYTAGLIPEEDEIIRITYFKQSHIINKTLLEYISEPSRSSSSYKQEVNIFEDEKYPFYQFIGEGAGGDTKTSFFYLKDKIILHVEHDYVYFDMDEFQEDGKVKDETKLIFDAVFIKEE